jgi:hypothetical protein
MNIEERIEQMFDNPDPEPARAELLMEQQRQLEYLETCNKLELKSLEVSKASKALNQLKSEEEALRVQREQQRKRIMGDDPGQNAEKGKPAPVYPYGHRGSGRFA